MTDFQLQGASNWYAVHCRSRAEKKIALHFSCKQLEHFVPMYTAIGKNRVSIQAPLFPGYLFVKISLAERLRVLETPGVVSLLGFGNETRRVSEAEMKRLRCIVARFTVEPHPLLVLGQKVRIVRGALEGCEGILERKKGSFHVVITMEAIMRSFSLEVDVRDVEPLTTSGTHWRGSQS